MSKQSTMEKKQILVTGATSGIGFATTVQLCEQQHKVTFTARNKEKAEETLQKLKSILPHADVSYCILNLDSFESVEMAIAELIEQHKPFDIVILNAAVMLPEEAESKYGFDTTFQVNYLGHYLLATALLACRPSGHHMHFVCLSSVLLKLFGGLPWSIPRNNVKFEQMFMPKEKSGWKSYALSKLALALFAETLNSLEEVTAVAVNPGNSMTSVTRNMKRRGFFKIFKKTLIPVDEAAGNVVQAAFHRRPTPATYLDKKKVAVLPKAARSESIQKALVEFTEKLLDGVAPERKRSGISV